MNPSTLPPLANDKGGPFGPKELVIGGAGETHTELLRLVTNKQPFSLRLKLKPHVEPAPPSSITGIWLTSAARQGGSHDPIMRDADFQVPTGSFPDIQILDANAVRIANFPVTPLPENGVFRLNDVPGGLAEYCLWVKGVGSVEVEGSIG